MKQANISEHVAVLALWLGGRALGNCGIMLRNCTTQTVPKGCMGRGRGGVPETPHVTRGVPATVQVSAPISTGSSPRTVAGLHPDAALAMTPTTRTAAGGPSAEFVSKNVGGSYVQPLLQSPLLASQRMVEVAADDRCGQPGFPTELGIQFIENVGDQLAAMGIVSVSTSCGPECARVFDRQVGRLVGEASADARVGVVLVTFPTPEQRADDSDDARTVDLEIPMEGAQEELAFLAVFNVRVPEIELQLSVNIRPATSRQRREACLSPPVRQTGACPGWACRA